MKAHRHAHGLPGPAGLGRRELLAGAGAAAVAGSLATLGLPGSALAKRGHSKLDVDPAPEPIPGGVDSGAPTVGFIHWWLPGPVGATTPVIGLEAMGLDVDPSTMTDYRGFSAYAVLAGSAKGSDGKLYDCEFDVRVMAGRYVAADGSVHQGTFGFF